MSDEDLIAKIKAALGGGTKPEDDDGDDEPRGGKVPYDRFAAVTRERSALKRQLGEALSLLEKERATGAKTIEQIKADAAKEVAGVAAQYEERIQARDLGFDEDGVAALRAAYSRLPEKGRPTSAVEWWRSVTADDEARKAVPKTLVAYLPAAPEKAPDKAPAKGGAGSVDRGARPAGSKVKADEVAGASSMAELMRALKGG